MRARKLSRQLRILLVLMLGLVLFPYETGLTQPPEDWLYFEETGHGIQGHFLNAFHAYGGLEVLGYPISQPFMDQGLLVQYFQKARMEWHPLNPPPYQVQLGLLGEELRYRQPGLDDPPAINRRKVYFPETGHTVGYAFLDFFRERGGVDTFGYPITEVFIEDGKVVQYFQRLTMVWHPNDPEAKVQIGNLGELYVQQHRDRMPPDAFQPLGYNARPSTAVSRIQGAISLRHYVMNPSRNQVATVLVLDQKGDPLPSAQVSLMLRRTTDREYNGNVLRLVTDEQGLVEATLPLEAGAPGVRIIVRAVITYQDLVTHAETSFLFW